MLSVRSKATVNPRMAKIKLANIPTGDFAGLRDWQARQINNYEGTPPRELTPYQKLMLAVLMDAVYTLKRDCKSRQNKRIHTLAEDWLMSDKANYCLGFVPICECFGWAPSRIRKQVLDYVAREHHHKVKRENVRSSWRVQPKKGRH